MKKRKIMIIPLTREGRGEKNYSKKISLLNSSQIIKFKDQKIMNKKSTCCPSLTNIPPKCLSKNNNNKM
jgi:hypothetical protein